jgi:hypothetical protein
MKRGERVTTSGDDKGEKERTFAQLHQNFHVINYFSRLRCARVVVRNLLVLVGKRTLLLVNQ